MTTPVASTASLGSSLDEATLRQVFPDAPADLQVPEDVGTLFRLRMSTMWNARRVLWLVLIAVVVVALAASLAAGNPVPGIALAVVALVALGTVAAIQHSRAAGDFFRAYVAARGLRDVGSSFSGAGTTPLLDKGDERTYARMMAGTIAGQPAQLGHFTYTVVTHDDNGRHEQDHDFTILHFPLPDQVAARYRGVYLRKNGLGLGKLQDKLAHDRGVQLESQAFNKRYNLRVRDDQDDVALYELFNPVFIDLLASRVEIHWEQVGPHLLFFRDGHETESADLDRFCLEAWQVLYRYLEEWQ